MSILGIRNRTENWKTAIYFSPMFGWGGVHLAKRLGEHTDTQPNEVQLELYWKGVRDYLNQSGGDMQSNAQDFTDRYKKLFPDLRKKVEDYGGLRTPNPLNYDVSDDARMQGLYNNLQNTEIDVVLESPNYLFIGEAKGEMELGADGSLVLVHQLVRQYVMARILIDRLQSEKEVIPFVVGISNRVEQVKFMLGQGWLKEENILDWHELERLC